MKKLLILLLLCLTTSAFGQYFTPHQKPMLGLQINWVHPLSDGLVGCWLFNEGSGNKVFDLSGSGHDGTLVNSPIWTSGDSGPVLQFDDANNRYIDIDDGTFFILDKITVVTRVKILSGAVNYDGIVTKSDWDNGWGLWCSNDFSSKIRWHCGNYEGAGSIISTAIWEGAGWVTVAGTYDRQNVRLYINGLEDASAAYTDAIADPGDHTLIGKYVSDNYVLDGYIKYVMIYNRALSASEIALLYREPFCMFKQDLPVSMMYTEAPTGVPVPVFYYHYVNHAILLLPLIPFSLWCYLRRRKCAA